MNKKKIENEKSCQMEIFLRSYVGIEDEKTINFLSSLTHKELKEVCRAMCAINLTCVPFEIVTKESLETGDLILVADKAKNLAPYINPIQANFDKIIEEETQRQIEKIYNIENQLPTFEEYTDEIDEIVLDTNVSNSHIKRLSYQRYRKEDKND